MPERVVLTPCAGKSGSSRLPNVLATSCSAEFQAIKLLAPWCSHSLVPSDFDGSPYQPGFRENSDQPQYVRCNGRLSLSWKMTLIILLPKINGPALGTIRHPNENLLIQCTTSGPLRDVKRRLPGSVLQWGTPEEVMFLFFIHRPQSPFSLLNHIILSFTCARLSSE